MGATASKKGAMARKASKFERIGDNYETLEQVREALRQNGLESCNLIVGVDFTGSNRETGRRSFGGKSLHHIDRHSGAMNPYEQAIATIAKTLSEFDEDGLVPGYGFGDATSGGTSVFSFKKAEMPCEGIEDVLERYRFFAERVCLYGPTSFVPIIDTAVRIVEESGGQFHVLVIVADGQITEMRETEEAIRRASGYALSIVMVGVGDGPWETMEGFDDRIKGRKFDNFQFVNFSKIVGGGDGKISGKHEAVFAMSALMEVPTQFQAAVELRLLGRKQGSCPKSVTIPPPM